MKSYPHIQTVGTHLIRSGRKLPVDLSEKWIGFDKLDGSLIRAEWKAGKGFYKLGRRGGLLDSSNPWLEESQDLITTQYDFLEDVFRDYGWDRVVAFFEFLGENSFAGTHVAEEHSVKLIDLSVHRTGLVDPNILIGMDIIDGAGCVHKGPVTYDIIQDIADGTMPGVTFEGVVFKRTTRKGHREMFKSKSDAWYERLRQKCGNDDTLFERLK